MSVLANLLPHGFPSYLAHFGTREYVILYLLIQKFNAVLIKCISVTTYDQMILLNTNEIQNITAKLILQYRKYFKEEIEGF